MLCRSWSIVVKRSSIRGFAGGHWPKADRHQARGRKVCRAVYSEIGQSRGARFESRLQKLVKCIFLVRTACEATRNRERPDSLKEDASLWRGRLLLR